MSGLNYFMPLERVPGNYENPLTRAFLSTLRVSPSLLISFYQLVRDGISDPGAQAQLPKQDALELDDVLIECQKGSLGSEAMTYVSVLITNDPIDFPGTITRSDRNAIYDGVISFGNGLKLFIENKPRNEHVWHGQMSPKVSDVPEQATLVEKPSIISWRVLIDTLNRLISYSAISGSERQILVDLREYINQFHGYLNPYKQLDQCGDHAELIWLRVEAILKGIALKPELVKYQQGWAYYIETEGHTGIDRVGLIVEDIGKPNWSLKLFIGYADTVKQSRDFYKKDLDFSVFDKFEQQDLTPHGNFHLSFMQRHLVWYWTDRKMVEAYLRYWHDNTEPIRQYKQDEIQIALDQWFKAGILIDDEKRRAELDETLFQTKRSTVNVSPGFVLTRTWSKDKAIKLDRNGGLAAEIRKSIIEGFEILREKAKFLKQLGQEDVNSI